MSNPVECSLSGYHKVVRHSRSTVCEKSLQELGKESQLLEPATAMKRKREEKKPACKDWKTGKVLVSSNG